MKNGGAKDFLAYLDGHPAVREVLKDAIAEDIVAAGAARGYQFTVDDLTDLLSDTSVHGGWGG